MADFRLKKKKEKKKRKKKRRKYQMAVKLSSRNAFCSLPIVYRRIASQFQAYGKGLV